MFSRGGRTLPTQLEKLERQARALSAEDRAKLAEALLESLQGPLAEIETAWEQEIEARVAAFDRGEMPEYPVEEILPRQ
jgi:putative addiction module component (TIGR02574 family)